jgi:hypothetical protein
MTPGIKRNQGESKESRRKTPLREPRKEFVRDLDVARNVGVLVSGEHIGVADPSRSVNEEDVLVSLRFPMSKMSETARFNQGAQMVIPVVDDRLVLALVVVSNASIGIWPSPLAGESDVNFQQRS